MIRRRFRLRGYRRGRRLLNVQLRRRLCPLEEFIADAEREKPVRVPGAAVFMSMIPDVLPPALLNNFRFGYMHRIGHRTNLGQGVTSPADFGLQGIPDCLGSVPDTGGGKKCGENGGETE